MAATAATANTNAHNNTLPTQSFTTKLSVCAQMVIYHVLYCYFCQLQDNLNVQPSKAALTPKLLSQRVIITHIPKHAGSRTTWLLKSK